MSKEDRNFIFCFSIYKNFISKGKGSKFFKTVIFQLGDFNKSFESSGRTGQLLVYYLEKRVDGILCLPVHFCFREHVEVRDEATARPNMLQRGEDFAGIRPWLLEDTVK
jgi:hypothetical protein